MALFIAGGYEFLEQIGEGSEATVYLARSQKFDQLFACKVLKPRKDVAKPEDLKEWKAICGLSHHSVIRCYAGFTMEDGQVVLVFEHCLGGTLQDEIDENPSGVSRERYIKLAKVLLNALHFIHSRSCAHRDLKPQNILFRDEVRVVPAIADFGLARVGAVAGVQATTGMVGSGFYIPMESWNRDAERDPFQADVWALGVIFTQLATGKLPWVGEPASQIAQIRRCEPTLDAGLDGDIAEMIMRMLTPKGRRATALELLQLPLFAGGGARPVVASRPGGLLATSRRRASAMVGVGLVPRIGWEFGCHESNGVGADAGFGLPG
jgi:serine/threonine-protein kinase